VDQSELSMGRCSEKRTTDDISVEELLGVVGELEDEGTACGWHKGTQGRQQMTPWNNVSSGRSGG
jgi:hypothetical protein